ncbi:Rec8 like protein-domain-containing protein [Hypoxylon crocopeplum]|nr:Rec8 like protein-domain-containing protein [Hypoxylon crocopeplum]
MFYSHEILTNRQYGVATIWLVATVGTGTSTRKVTRKAIQEVDVQKACGKIIQPGAPVALRLQGQLLYGVSTVYNKQCSYMLADLMKIQMHMHMFFTTFGENQLDPEAGKTRPENLLIMNDPDFVPDMRLPQFDLNALLVNSSQRTNKTSSQMSPFNTFLQGSGSPRSGLNIQLDIHNSDSPGSQDSPFGLQGLSSAQKPESQHLIINQEDEFAGAGDWGMEIDEDGNIFEMAEPAIVQDQFELPPLPRMESEAQGQAGPEQQDQPIFDGEGDIVMMEEPQLGAPGAAALSDHRHDAFQSDEQQRQAPARRKRRGRVLHADEETQISRNAMREQQENYLENCGTKKTRTMGAAQARTNAMLLTFGLGLGNIGLSLGIPGMVHPLALDFSGDSLFTAFTGLTVPEQPRGTRRSASESIEDGDEQNERRIKPRLESDADQQGRGLEGDFVYGDDIQQVHSSPEVGREAQAAMSDHLSSAMRMPWNRGSSAVPGSFIHGSAQKGHIPSSPLAHLGRDIQDLMRFSDGPTFGDDGFDFGVGMPHSNDDLFGGFELGEGVGEMQDEDVAQQQQKKPEQEQEASGWPDLDIQGRNFLSFMEMAIRANGERRLDEDFECNRRWIAFNDLFVPQETPRATAAHAFYHVLCLATQGKIEVEQEGDWREPFGSIWAGVKLADDAGDVGAIVVGAE